ncbi:DNA-binding transcriptional regulator, GntR family [Faunimonas pinastri]|uniref:DNA-binding transcriptional regulator, GntR family n=1 Tax=Faunimonas pinastri TaxID=1855383 RepID=A0A1H8ZEL1_9HYPH|nr:GntR family transcriptional regulator [Faunimonas pinastri]SEP62880.1 DNA-binding transcriptional regulator, GntR family [Faunimonas pinastri]
MLLDPLDRIRSSEPVARQIRQALHQAIVTMRIRPGEMLSEKDIAARFGVSRQPVREAFIKLGEAGLVRILPQRGTLVVKISRVLVEDARFLRSAVEAAVIREVAQSTDARSLTMLEGNMDHQRRSVEAGDTQTFYFLDNEFHRLLATAAGRITAWGVVEDMKLQMDRVRYLSMSDPAPMHVAMEQHEVIMEAVLARDPDRAEAAMKRHLSEIRLSLNELCEKYPDLFEDQEQADRL